MSLPGKPRSSMTERIVSPNNKAEEVGLDVSLRPNAWTY
jgi:hypothetical protein